MTVKAGRKAPSESNDFTVKRVICLLLVLGLWQSFFGALGIDHGGLLARGICRVEFGLFPKH